MTTFNREASIQGQTAVKSAADIIAAQIAAGQLVGEPATAVTELADVLFGATVQFATSGAYDDVTVSNTTGSSGGGGYSKPAAAPFNPSDPGGYTLPKGKHAGKTLSQIAELKDGKSYLKWMSEKWDEPAGREGAAALLG